MDLFYKRFDQARTALYVLFMSFLLLPTMAQANALFIVSDVEVDVTAKSALEAREQAFAQAQVKAFDILAERMLPSDQRESFATPDPVTISTLIMDFEVTKEKLSNVRYVGTYKFRFKEAGVKKLFSNAGVSFTDVASKQLLVLPFYEHQGRLTLWSPYNVWMQGWNRIDGKNALVPVVVPIGDLSDVKDIGDDEAMSYSPSKLGNLLERYDSAEAVLAIARPDADFAIIGKSGAPAVGSLGIEIYRTDRQTPQRVQSFRVDAKGGETRDAMIDRAIADVQKILRQDWKDKTSISSTDLNNVQVRVPLENFQQWAETERVLRQVSGINAIALKSLSPRQAIVDLIYQGDDARLKLALQQSDISLTNAAAGGPWVYDLRLNRFTGADAQLEKNLNRLQPMNTPDYEPANGGYVAQPQIEPPPQMPQEAMPSAGDEGYSQRF
jgi:hypothetical protein